MMISPTHIMYVPCGGDNPSKLKVLANTNDSDGGNVDVTVADIEALPSILEKDAQARASFTQQMLDMGAFVVTFNN